MAADSIPLHNALPLNSNVQLTDLSEDEENTLKRLSARLTASVVNQPLPDKEVQLGFNVLDRYYNGNQRLEQLGIAVPDDLRRFVTIVSWPATLVDTIEERCDVEGFRLPGQSDADKDLWEVWQANDLDVESSLGHIDSLVFSRSYVCVGAGDSGEPPLVTVESPREMVHEWSPRNRQVSSAARFYVDQSSGQTLLKATLYGPTATTWLVNEGDSKWQIEDRDDHNLGRCPVVPLVNRSRLGSRYGRSEMLRIITLTDAAARALTNAQVATEVMSLPQRWAAGMTSADFKDPKTGEEVTAWESYMGRLWVTGNSEAKFGQFSAADLGNFERIVNLYAQQVGGVTGLPMRFLGQLSANPPSGDGIRADETRLIKTAQRKMRSWGAGWESVMRLVRLVQTGKDDPKLSSMETLWADAGTPTKAADTDAAVKMYQAGLVTKPQAREDVGYTSVQISNMEEYDLAHPPPAVVLPGTPGDQTTPTTTPALPKAPTPAEPARPTPALLAGTKKPPAN